MLFCKVHLAFLSFSALFYENIWKVDEKAVLLHRVFHGIRFKVK